MGEKGQVIEIKDEIAVVKINRTEACAKCRACVNGMNKNEMLIEAKNRCYADVGDWVEIDLQSQDFLKAVGIMYGIPLITLLFGFVFGNFAVEYTQYRDYSEIAGFVLGILFMSMTYLWIKHRESHWKQQNYSPVAVKKF